MKKSMLYLLYYYCFYVNISVLKLGVKRQRQTAISVDGRRTRSIITSTRIENQFLDFVNPFTVNGDESVLTFDASYKLWVDDKHFVF